MGMNQTLKVLNGMVADGVIATYAIGGAVAAYNYVEASVTEDLDILVSFDADHQTTSGLITLGPIYGYLMDKGHDEFHKEGIMIQGWVVQFLPVASDLDAEGLRDAEQVDFDGADGEGSVPTRILRPEHIVATALKVNRAKDRTRIVQFVEENAVDMDALKDVLERHDLTGAWQKFCDATGIDNVLAIGSKTP